ncbi:TetR/AcrR family transcriptional regulator [Streptomyces sp. NPDC127108]|uniref:TetR/AcrR family transcriptional regulator n=1 Tax=Streptomyces sp. NPDC127108 TaxID=3345361 RepID=UPI00363FBC94
MKATGSVTTPVPAGRARARNRRGEGGRLRAEIIDAASDLLDETGDQHAVTLRSVARRVGVSTPSIYRHFPDHAAVMLAVVQRQFAGLERLLRAAVEQAGDDPRQRLLAVCDTYLDFARHHPSRYRTMFGGLWTPSPADSSLTETDRVMLGASSMAVLVDALGDCATVGAVTSTDVPTDATALWVGLHGLAHQRVVTPSFHCPQHITERVITSLARLTES